MKPKVLTFIITKDVVEPECLASVKAQTYPNHDYIVVTTPPKKYSDNYIVNLYKNCSANREKARKLALESDADYFLSLDSDVVLPPNAVAEFVRQARPDNRIVGGWYQMIRSGRWVAGRWVADNTFLNFRKPEPSLVKTDMVGLGCAFLPRKVLEAIPFEDGTDLVSKAPNGQPLIVGECGVFGNRAAELRFPMFMDGGVICKHLERR